MKKSFIFTLALLLSAVTAMAQYTTDGYYRVQNLGSSRFIYVTDNTGSFDIKTERGDFGALILEKGKEKTLANPASVIYIKKMGAEQFDLRAQNTGIFKLVSRYVDVRMSTAGPYRNSYTVSATEMGFTKYLSDNEKGKFDDGVMGIDADGAYQQWLVFPVSASSSDDYLGVKPSVQVGGKYYQPYFCDIPFTFYSSGMKAYTISKVDEDLGMAVLSPLSGMVPASTPVLIECSSADASMNRLNLQVSSAPAPSGNKLEGIMFCSPNRIKSPDACTLYDANTMRVLGKTSDGKLAFVKDNGNLYTYNGKQYLPGNQSYLPVGRTCPANVQVVTEAEYQEALNTRTFALIYMVDGKEYRREEMKIGTSITPIAAPTKEGYTFSGWTGLPTTMPAHDVTVTGSFTVNSYTVTWILDGNTYRTEKYNYGATLTVPDVPAKEGHTFVGWQEIPGTMPAADITIKGSYKVNTYTVTYMVDNVVYKKTTAEYGAALSLLDAPTKEGYTFSGWSALPATMPAHDVTVTGGFTVNSYTVTWVLEGNTYRTESYNYGVALSAIEVPTREGYTFTGWTGLPDSMPAHDVTVSGSYKINTYIVTYVIDNVTYKTVTAEYGASLTLLDTPEREGYTFSGWSELPATMPAHNVTVTGSFKVNSYTVTWVLDGETYRTTRCDYGTTLVGLEVPAKEGYSFMGWTGIPNRMPAHDVTISGSYKINVYTVTYVLDNVTYKSMQVEYGSELTLFDAPTKEGYTFSGWSELPATMPAHDVTVRGSFQVNSYVLTYYLDFGNGEVEVYRTRSYAYGSSLSAPTSAPTRTGYSFKGWSEETPSIMPAHDLTIYGYYTPNLYKVTYMVGIKVVHVDEVPFGSPIPEYVYEPEDKNEKFVGWIGTVYETMPAKNIIYKANIVTGLSEVKAADAKEDVIYDLSGRRLNSIPERGAFILNGKRMVK